MSVKGRVFPWRAGRGPQLMRLARPASWAPRLPLNRGVAATSMPV